MPLKYNPVRDEPEPEKAFTAWHSIVVGLVLLCAFLGYKAFNPTPVAPLAVAPEPPKIVEAPAPTPTPRPARLAPQGTLYVINYIAVKTKSGVIGFEPGREVHFVQALQEQQKLLVTDGEFQAVVDPSQLTNDMDVAALARMQDAASQQQLASYREAEKQRFQQDQRAMDLAHSKEIAQVNAKLASSSAVGAFNTSLNNISEAASSYDRARVRRIAEGDPYSYFYSRTSTLQRVSGGY